MHEDENISAARARLHPLLISAAILLSVAALVAAGVEQVAAKNGKPTVDAELAELLRTDPSAGVTSDGDLYWADEGLFSSAADDEPGPLASGASTVPMADTPAFELHSNPGASRKILVDFNGATVTGTAWNTEFGLPNDPITGWDPAGNGPTFTAAELDKVRHVWAIVADRFAQWDVDVTTEEPHPDAMNRANLNDTTYGTRVVVTSNRPNIPVFQDKNGVALSAFDQVNEPSVAFVFPHGFVAFRSLADVIAHELGHTFGLQHHGFTDEENIIRDTYSGQAEGFLASRGNWSPIMGAVGTAIVQWSKGEYPRAYNVNADQDDLRSISSFLNVRTDEAPGSAATAVPIPVSPAVITDEHDVDSYLLGTCTAGATATVTPTAIGSSLDIEARLVRPGDAGPIMVANPPSFIARASEMPADGGEGWGYEVGGNLDASVKVATAGGGYVLQVRGGGNGEWNDDGVGPYGSVGTYEIATTGCNGNAPAGAPATPTGLVATPHATAASVTLNWNAVAGATGYTIAVGDRELTTTSATTIVIDNLRFATSYSFAVTARNASGTSRAAQVIGTTAVGVPDAPRTAHATATGSPSVIAVYWSRPNFDGGTPITASKIYRQVGGDLVLLDTLVGNEGSHALEGLALGNYRLAITAVNAAGESAPRWLNEVSLGGAPAVPTDVEAVARDRSAAVSWTAAQAWPAVTSYTVTSNPGGITTTTPNGNATETVLTGLTDGVEYTFTVIATNTNGNSLPSDPSDVVIPGIAPVTTDNVPRAASDGTITVTLSATDETAGAGDIQTRFTIGTEASPAADPRTSGAIYNSNSKPTLSHGEYIRYSSRENTANIEEPKRSATARIPARLTAAPHLQSASRAPGAVAQLTTTTRIPAGATLAYQWQRTTYNSNSWLDIPDATGTSYTLTAADAGYRIRARVTVSAPGFQTTSSTTLGSAVVRSATDAGPKPLNPTLDGSFATEETSDGNAGTGPNDIAVDAAGFVYVPNEGNDRIQKFTANGELVDVWPAPKPGPWRTYIVGLDAGPNGHVYAYDVNHRRVIEYDPFGALVQQWLVPLLGDLRYSDGRAGITVDDATGRVFVADSLGNYSAIHRFDANGANHVVWGGHGTGSQNFNNPTDMAVSAGKLYVADTWNNRIQVLNASTGAFITSHNGAASSGGMQFDQPTDIAVDSAGNFYVLEDGWNFPNPKRIQKFDSNFTFLELVPLPGVELTPGSLASVTPSGIEIGTNNQIYVAKNYPAEEVGLFGEPVRYAPDEPTNVVAVAGDEEATLSWNPPASTNGRAITEYEVLVQRGNVPPVPVKVTTDTTTTVTGLDNGLAHRFTVKARNAAGLSPESELSGWVVPERPLTATNITLEATGTSTLAATVTPENAEGFVYLKLGETILRTAWFEGGGPVTFDVNSAGLVRGTYAFTSEFQPIGPGGDGFAGSTSNSVSMAVTSTPWIIQPQRLAITGTYKVGKTLSVKTTGKWTPANAKVTYKWLANGKAIKKATKPKLKLAKAQRGKVISVQVSAKASGYKKFALKIKGKKVK